MVKYVVGIDEVGRGPLAGPITLCAVSFKEPIKRSAFKGLKDSKQLSVDQRKKWSDILKGYKKQKKLDYKISSVSSEIIDRKGISFATRLAIKRCLRRLMLNPKNCQILLDGSLYAPIEYRNQKTIIGGDRSEVVISAASVLAKVFRDKKMIKFSKVFPGYGFEVHKGYGTKSHFGSIKRQGPSKIHRKSFLKGLWG